MAKVKKPKRDNRIVTYVPLTPEDHEMIAQIAKKRGYPYTIASIAAEMISKALASEAPEKNAS